MLCAFELSTESWNAIKQSAYVTNVTSQTTGVLLGLCCCCWCCCCCLFVAAGIAQSLTGYELDERGSIPRKCERIFSVVKRPDRLCDLRGYQWHCRWGSEGQLCMLVTVGVSEVDLTCSAHRCWTLYCPLVTIYHQFDIQQSCFLLTQCIYVFCVDLRKNSDYFLIQH